MRHMGYSKGACNSASSRHSEACVVIGKMARYGEATAAGTREHGYDIQKGK